MPAGRRGAKAVYGKGIVGLRPQSIAAPGVREHVVEPACVNQHRFPVIKKAKMKEVIMMVSGVHWRPGLIEPEEECMPGCVESVPAAPWERLDRVFFSSVLRSIACREAEKPCPGITP